MKKTLSLLTISVSMLNGMIEKPDREKQVRSTESQHDQARLWQLLGNSGVPTLEFIIALPYVKQSDATINSLNIPEGLKGNILNVKKRFGMKLSDLLRQASRVLKKPLNESNSEDAVFLINAGADVNAHDEQYDNTVPLIIASRADKEMVQLLISHGADVNAQNKFGTTALLDAAFHGREDIVKILLDAGADVNQHDTDGETALLISLAKSRVRIAKLLIDAGANVNVQDAKGRTSLMLAAQNGLVDIIKRLFEKNADITLKDIMGRTAPDYAFWPDIKQMLKEAVPSPTDN
jgi:ankyrin repeat protein